MRRASSIAFALSIVLFAFEVSAQVPMTSSGVELSANARAVGVGAQWRDAETAVGIGGDIRFDARRVRFGPLLSETLVHHRAYQLRAPMALNFSTFLDRDRWGAGAELGLRNVIRTRFLMFWLGSELDVATTMTQPVEQRFTPGLDVGFAVGGTRHLPAIAAHGSMGYTIGGTGPGALVSEAWLSLVFDRWFGSFDE